MTYWSVVARNLVAQSTTLNIKREIFDVFINFNLVITLLFYSE